MTSRALIFSILLSGGLAGPVFADDRGSEADQDACTPDVFRLCSDYIPNEGPIVACLQAKGPQLSPACHKIFFPTPASPANKGRTTMADSRTPRVHRSIRKTLGHHHRHPAAQ